MFLIKTTQLKWKGETNQATVLFEFSTKIDKFFPKVHTPTGEKKEVTETACFNKEKHYGHSCFHN